MNMPLMALLLVLLLTIWLFIRHRRATSSEPPRPTAPGGSPKTAYHAVSIKFSGNACKPARDLEGRRFLATAAPRLPLPECEVLECSCRFVHHKDRRAGKDRRSPFGPAGFGGSTGNYSQELRKGTDRRTSDDDDLF